MKRIVIVLLIGLGVASCSKKDGAVSSPFAGNWRGNYTGNGDTGSFTMNVASTGTVSGSAVSLQYSQTFQLSGAVNANGSFSASTSGTSTSGATFTGTMNDGSASGTWINTSTSPNYSGIWSGTKQ